MFLSLHYFIEACKGIPCYNIIPAKIRHIISNFNPRRLLLNFLKRLNKNRFTHPSLFFRLSDSGQKANRPLDVFQIKVEQNALPSFCLSGIRGPCY